MMYAAYDTRQDNFWVAGSSEELFLKMGWSFCRDTGTVIFNVKGYMPVEYPQRYKWVGKRQPNGYTYTSQDTPWNNIEECYRDALSDARSMFGIAIPSITFLQSGR